MVKESIKKYLKEKGKFLIIGKNAYNVSKKLTALDKRGASIFDNVNELPKAAQQAFYSELRMPEKVVIGLIKKDMNLPNVIKEHCMILRLKE